MQRRELVGLWGSEPYDYGVMEATDLALLADGRGWYHWSNSAGGMDVQRLTWRSPEEGVVELQCTLGLSGSWEVTGDMTEARPTVQLVSLDSQDVDDTLIRARYTLLTDTTPMAPEPFQALHLSEDVLFCNAFGLLRREVSIVDDPSYRLVSWS